MYVVLMMEQIKEYTLEPDRFGLTACKAKDIAGGTPEDNAEIIKKILSGSDTGPKRDIVTINAGAGIFVGGKAESMESGIKMAEESLDSGNATKILKKLQAAKYIDQ